jgi:hypothetical protein
MANAAAALTAADRAGKGGGFACDACWFMNRLTDECETEVEDDVDDVDTKDEFSCLLNADELGVDGMPRLHFKEEEI